MSTTGTSEAAAKFIKTYTHDKFIKPSMKIYHSSETDSTYCNTNFYDVHLSDKVLPFLGNLQFEPLKKTSSHKSSTGSLNNPGSISEGEERDWNDSSYEETDEVDNGDKVPELVRPRQVYKPELSRSPRKNITCMLDVDENAKVYLKGRGSLRRASAPVVVITDLEERNEPTPLATVSKDEGDVPETPASVIELLKQEAAIRSQVNLRCMKHLEYRRGSCIPKVHSSPGLEATAKPISSARVHKIMQTFFGPQTKKQQQDEMKQVGVLDPATKSSNIKIQSAPKVLGGHAGMAGSPPRQPVIPVAPPPPEIMPSALLGNEKGTSDMPEVKPTPVVLEKPKLTEVVATLNPTISLSTADQFSEVMRRSSVSQDLEDTFKKMDRGSAEFSDSGSFTQSGESGSGSSWFGGLIGLRPVPAPRKPGETRPAPVKKKVKKRDLNAFAPAGF